MDRTKYPDDQVPDLALRPVFGRQRLPQNLCLLMASSGLLNVETFAMLGSLERESRLYPEDDRG